MRYAGIGSRSLPYHKERIVVKYAKLLSDLDFVLHSGGADGTDSVFEFNSSKFVIFLPWNGFNGRNTAKSEDNRKYIVPELNLEYVKKYHPRPDLLGRSAKLLMSRNSYQVLGENLEVPVNFVLCWTDDGTDKGGTSQALRIARDRGIPCFNIENRFDMIAFDDFLEKHSRVLMSKCIASCNCLTKTPDEKYHNENCTYVKLRYQIRSIKEYLENGFAEKI